MNATRTISFANTCNFGSVSVFVFVVKEAFDSPCLPQDYKDKIEISELVVFFNKRFTEFFVFTAKQELDVKKNVFLYENPLTYTRMLTCGR